MFDIGFWELAIIGVVALLVIGPERLPAVARAAGKWIGKTKQFVASVQSDIGSELNKTEELKVLLEKQSQIKEMHEIIENTVDETRKSVSVGINKLDQTNTASDSKEQNESQQEPEKNSAVSSKSIPDGAVNEQTK